MKIFTLTNILLCCFFLPLATLAQEHQQHHHPQVNPHDGVAHKHHQHDLRLVPMARWKFYGGIGATTYAGEVTGKQLSGDNSILKSIEPRLSFTGGTAYKVNDRIFVKAELGYYKIKAVENEATTAKRGPNGRGYYFKANNIDFAVLGQLNILPYKYLVGQGLNIVPYAVLGVGFTTSNPKVQVGEGDWRTLNELSDGQVKNKILATFPMGLGIMYRVNAQFDIGLEGTLRYTTGSLDGDSKDGINTTNLSEEAKAYFDKGYNKDATIVLKDNPKFNDMYTNIQIRFNYTFIGEKYKHLFKQKDINASHHNNIYNHHLRVHE